MGQIFQRKRRRPDGTEYTDSSWWIRYYDPAKGYTVSECTGKKKPRDAQTILRQREGAKDRGEAITRPKKTLLTELTADVIADYNSNGYTSVADTERRFTKHIEPFFAGRRVSSISKADIADFRAHRQSQGASNAEINRELSALQRAFTLAIENGKATTSPVVKRMKENNVRQGFFEPDQFERVQSHVTAPIRLLIEFAYVTGWRKGEIINLEWRNVDFDAGEVRLEPGTTKNDDGRTFPFTKRLRTLLEAQRRYTDEVQRSRGMIVRFVFHRNGRQVKDFRKDWEHACLQAGVPGQLVHDFRRTAVRNLVRSGIPESVAMKMTGHKTNSVFKRYNIVSKGDLTHAAYLLDEHDSSTISSAKRVSDASRKP